MREGDPRISLDPSSQLLISGRVYVPDTDGLRTLITQIHHDHHLAGHPGIQRTLQKVRQQYW
jgi:hypothetical protein